LFDAFSLREPVSTSLENAVVKPIDHERGASFGALLPTVPGAG
jgi:hypothetical protein